MTGKRKKGNDKKLKADQRRKTKGKERTEKEGEGRK